MTLLSLSWMSQPLRVVRAVELPTVPCLASLDCWWALDQSAEVALAKSA